MSLNIPEKIEIVQNANNLKFLCSSYQVLLCLNFLLCFAILHLSILAKFTYCFMVCIWSDMIILYFLIQNDSSCGEVQIIGGDDLSRLTGKVRLITVHTVLL